MRFDLTDLRLFRHIAETGSITHGAERSHLALASASARIRGMEAMLDVPLLQRGRRGVRLTAAGRSLLDHARIVLQQVDAMRGDLSAYSRGLKGSVRVLANTAALSEHLPRLLGMNAHFRRGLAERARQRAQRRLAPRADAQSEVDVLEQGRVEAVRVHGDE